MTDETGTETQPSGVVDVEEFLFGTAADDSPDDASEQLPAGDATDEAGDAEADAEPDTAAEEPATADDAGEQPASADTEASEELKVVLSIRGGRATIGVQQPSSDPHIESFDDPDLFGLADQFPAVVARARAIWEEDPRHPAYVNPTPPPKQRNRRQQAADTPTADGETEQPQPETLRLF